MIFLKIFLKYKSGGKNLPGLKGKIKTQKELEDEGWQLIMVVTNVHLIFANGNKRICWNSETGIIEKEYSI